MGDGTSVPPDQGCEGIFSLSFERPLITRTVAWES